MTNDPLVRKLMKAAKQRLTSSEALLSQSQFLDSIYLGGYGVECALKALLLARTPPKKRRNVEEQVFRGKSRHDFENLKARLRKLGVIFSPPIIARFRPVSTWSTEPRYEVGTGSAEDAEVFHEAAKAIVRWLEEQL